MFYSRDTTGSKPSKGNKKRKRTDNDKRGLLADMTNINQFDAVKKLVKRSKKVEQRRKKDPKVPTKFRRAVREVMEEDNYYGRWSNIGSGPMLTDASPAIPENNHKINQIANSLGPNGYEGYYFTPYEIHQVVNEIWDIVPHTIDIEPTIPLNVVNKPSPETVGASTFSCTIKNSYVKFRYKNNSQRTFQIDLYNCAPKTYGCARDKTMSLGSIFSEANQTTASRLFIGTPVNQWVNGVVDQKKNGKLNSEYNEQFLIAKPTDSMAFTRTFNYEKTTIILAPGQSENYTIQGPSNYKYSFAKHCKDGLFLDLDPTCRNVMQVIRSEQLSLEDRTKGHPVPAYTILNTNGEVEIECVKYWNIEMPDQVGTKSIAVGGIQQPLGARRSKVCKYNDLSSSDGSTKSKTVLAQAPSLDVIPDD